MCRPPSRYGYQPNAFSRLSSSPRFTPSLYSYGCTRQPQISRVPGLTRSCAYSVRCRYRRHVGLAVALAAFRDYRRKHRGGIDALGAAARADWAYPLMRAYLEALAS